MRMYPVIFLLALIAVSCNSDIVFKNTTRPGGYALGERVSLKFSITAAKGLPDSIPVNVIEKKSGYRYELFATKGECDSVCNYTAVWDGRKSDGSWPMGGRYNVFSRLDYGKGVYSDTVEIGLGD